jgi:hypothetical protein
MGRTSLMLIIAFNITFVAMGFGLSRITSWAYDKYCGYADIEQSQLTAESCANIAISAALLDTPRITVQNRCSSTAMFGKSGTSFTVNQYPTFDGVGVQNGESLMVVGSIPLPSAIKLDYPPDLDPHLICTTLVKVQGNSFSQYVFYSVSENGVSWTAGDTCRGKLHTQDQLNCIGSNGPPKTGPDFKGFVTTKLGVKVSSGQPNFEQQYGVADISLPTELTDLNKWGKTENGGRFINKLDTYVLFKSDGTITVRTEPPGTAQSGTTCWNESSTAMNAPPNNTIPKCTTYASTSALAASGVVLVQNAALHVEGVLDGRITLGCVDTLNASKQKSNLSQVFIDNSITYKDAPPCTRVPSRSSTDMLGIVATNNITVSQYVNHDGVAKVSLNNVNLNASMFSQTGSFTAENYSGRGDCGKLTLVGGLQQNIRGAVGQPGTPFNGFLKDYDWDNNLQNGSPIGYPTTKFLIKSWVDRTTIPEGFWK